METKEIKEKIIEQLDELPEDKLKKLLNFVNIQLSKKERPFLKQFSLEEDPILALIGNVEVEPFSHSIDDELYGPIK